MSIHPTALVSAKAHVADTAFIGPYCIIGDDVRIDDHVRLLSHVVVDGSTHINAHTTVYPFATIGMASQDLTYRGEKTSVSIGSHTTIREHVTIHRGTLKDIGITHVGSHTLLMVGVHVAHDCFVGDHVVIANSVLLAGHVSVLDHAVIGGLSAVQQRFSIGSYAMMGGASGVNGNILPYALYTGTRDGRIQGLNLIGLRRHGFTHTDVNRIKKAFSILYNPDGTFLDNVAHLVEEQKAHPNFIPYTVLLDFIKTYGDQPFAPSVSLS